MNLQQPRTVSLLLVVLGLSLLWTGGSISGPETNVQQYTAYEVTHEDGELVLTSVKTGAERRNMSASTTNIDERIVCVPPGTRECDLAWMEYQGEINSSAISSEFRYAYFNGQFYRLTRTEELAFEYERMNSSDVFPRLALDSDRLTEMERDVLTDGATVSTHPAPHTHRLVESDGRYYTILKTGSKSYSTFGSSCGSAGDDFCDRADTVRWMDWLSGVGFGILGALGVSIGARGLLREYRSD